MILRRVSRAAGLAMIFVGMFAVAVLLAPIALAPMMFEERGFLGVYGRFLAGLVSADSMTRADVWIMLAVMAAWAGTQVAFLSPLVGPPRVESQGRSIVPSVVVAALLGSLGCALLWVAVIEGIYAFVSDGTDAFNTRYGIVVGSGYLTALGVWIAGGFMWYLLLSRAGSLRNPAGLDRLVRWLFAGTCVEMLLGVVCYLTVRKKTDCYCAMASFWNLVFGTAMLVWMCGPWAVLLVTRQERLSWARGACAQCGYPRRTDADLCPECGARHVPSSARH
jgi:hypothetical protein